MYENIPTKVVKEIREFHLGKGIHCPLCEFVDDECEVCRLLSEDAYIDCENYLQGLLKDEDIVKICDRILEERG